MLHRSDTHLIRDAAEGIRHLAAEQGVELGVDVDLVTDAIYDVVRVYLVVLHDAVDHIVFVYADVILDAVHDAVFDLTWVADVPLDLLGDVIFDAGCIEVTRHLAHDLVFDIGHIKPVVHDVGQDIVLPQVAGDLISEVLHNLIGVDEIGKVADRMGLDALDQGSGIRDQDLDDPGDGTGAEVGEGVLDGVLDVHTYLFFYPASLRLILRRTGDGWEGRQSAYATHLVQACTKWAGEGDQTGIGTGVWMRVVPLTRLHSIVQAVSGISDNLSASMNAA